MPASIVARPVVRGNRLDSMHRLYIKRMTSSFSRSGTAVQTTLTSAHLELGCAAQYSPCTRRAKFLKLSNCRLLRPSFSWTWAGESRNLIVLMATRMGDARQRYNGKKEVDSKRHRITLPVMMADLGLGRLFSLTAKQDPEKRTLPSLVTL